MDPLDIISQVFNLHPALIGGMILLGFAILFTLCSGKSFYNNLGEIEKLLLFLSIGFVAYVLILLSLRLTIGTFSLFFSYKDMTLSEAQNLFFYSSITLSLVMLYFFSVRKIKVFFYYITLWSISLFLIFSIMLGIFSIVAYFSSYNFLSGELIIRTIIAGALSIGLFLISKEFCPKVSIGIDRISKQNILPPPSVFKLLIFGIILFVVAYIAAIPSITYYDERVTGYLFIGEEQTPEYINNYPYLWKSYQLIERPFKVVRSGIFGWVPISYDNIITNSTESKVNYEFSIKFDKYPYGDIKLTELNHGLSDYSVRNMENESIKNATMDYNYDKAILFLKKPFSTVNGTRIAGYKNFTGEKNFSITEMNPYMGDSIIFFVNVTNDFDVPIEIDDISLSEYRKHEDKTRNCTKWSVSGKITRNTGEKMPLDSNCGLLYGRCSAYGHGGAIDYLEMDRPEGNIVLYIRKLVLEQKSNLIIFNEFRCQFSVKIT